MKRPPEQEPDNSEHSASDFKEPTAWHLPEKTDEFEYKESTEETISKSQHFHYEGNDLPEKE